MKPSIKKSFLRNITDKELSLLEGELGIGFGMTRYFTEGTEIHVAERLYTCLLDSDGLFRSVVLVPKKHYFSSIKELRIGIYKIIWKTIISIVLAPHYNT
jgi:hypothetical protein